MTRFGIVALALTLTAGVAGAQFTTVVAPPPPAEAAGPAPAEVAARDTARRTALRDMSAWVDSVAGVAPAVEPGVVTDSATGSVAQTEQEPTQPVTRFEEGARAPDTATSLPALLIGGVLVTALGTILLFTTRRRDA